MRRRGCGRSGRHQHLSCIHGRSGLHLRRPAWATTTAGVVGRLRVHHVSAANSSTRRSRYREYLLLFYFFQSDLEYFLTSKIKLIYSIFFLSSILSILACLTDGTRPILIVFFIYFFCNETLMRWSPRPGGTAAGINKAPCNIAFDLFGARNTTRRPPVTSRARHSPSSRRLPLEVDQQPTFRACSLTSATCYVITCALMIFFTSPTHAGDYLDNLGRLQLTLATCCIYVHRTTDHQRCIADLFGISARRPRLRRHHKLSFVCN
jgi:hypothetical protein